MFDIGFPELLVIAIVGLLVIGPERLPEALRTLGLWIGRLRRSFNNVKTEIEKEIGMDDIRRQLHNEAVMEEMRRIERDVRDSVNSGAADERAARSHEQPAGSEPAEAPGVGEAAAGASEGAVSSERPADASAQPPSGPSPAPGTTPRGASHADDANDDHAHNDNKHDDNRQHG